MLHCQLRYKAGRTSYLLPLLSKLDVSPHQGPFARRPASLTRDGHVRLCNHLSGSSLDTFLFACTDQSYKVLIAARYNDKTSSLPGVIGIGHRCTVARY